MTYRLYKIYSAILFFAITLIFLFRHYIESQEIILIAPVLLSLSSLYLNIFAFIFKVELNVKINRSTTLFCLLASMILLFCALAPTVIAYNSLSETMSSIFTANKTEILAIESFTPATSYNNDSAKVYFRKTGVPVEYFDIGGSKSFYSPDQIDKLYFKLFKTYHHLKLNLINVKNILFYNLLIIFSSSIVFLVYLLFMKKVKKRSGLTF